MLSPCSQSQSPSNSSNSCLPNTRMPLKSQKFSYNSFKANAPTTTASSPFLMPAEFYKSLFATAVLHHSNNINEAHHHHHNQQQQHNCETSTRTQTQSCLNESRYFKHAASSATSPVAYSCASVAAASTTTASSVSNTSATHFPRNLLFSSSAAAVAAMAESVKRSHANEKVNKISQKDRLLLRGISYISVFFFNNFETKQKILQSKKQ